jgi:hypothetical protein
LDLCKNIAKISIWLTNLPKLIFLKF